MTSHLPVSSDAVIDFIELSRSRLLCVVFPKTNSPYYRHAIDVARQGQEYRESKGEAGVVHACSFPRTSGGAARAMQLLIWTRGWAGTQVFTAGRYNTRVDEVIHTLDCYQQALACSDTRAHCLVVADNVLPDSRCEGALTFTIHIADTPPAPELPRRGRRFVLPCRRACHGFRIAPAHPSDWAHQFQQAAVEHASDWCPLLDLSAFRQYD